jgi:signal transduction histidine kinase
MKNFSGPLESSRCPVTGLTVFSKPEWIDVNFGKSYRVSFNLLGERIIFLKCTGYGTFHDIKHFVMLSEKVKNEAVSKVGPYIRIEDWTDLTGTSRRAREEYIHYLIDYEQPEALILYGLSSMFKAGVRLGRRIYKLNFDVKIASGYSEAVTLAQNILSKSQNKFENFPKGIKFPSPHTSDKNRPPPKIISQPDWSYQSEGFSMRCEILYQQVLHIMSTGKFKEEDVGPIFQVLSKVSGTLNFSTNSCYAVLHLQNSKGTRQKARISYYKATKKLYQKFPFKMTILYGVNRFLKAAINFNRHFMPIKVCITDDLEDALVLVDKNKSEVENPQPKYQEKHPEIDPHYPDKIERYENELLKFIENIDWQNNDLEQNTNIDPAHPFARVFDALAMVKWELDDLISERTRTGEKLKKAKERAEAANLAKSEFLANMSHELRTPLNHIIGFTELLIDKTFGDLNEVQEEYLNDVHHSSKHLLSLINDILDLSKVETGKQKLELTDTNLKEVLENSLNMIMEKAMKHGIRLSVEIDDIPEIIRVDQRKFRQIMYNLLANAVKFTDDGGKIHLSADLVDGSWLKALRKSAVGSEENPAEMSHGGKVTEKFVRICVTDSGIGVEQDDLERIFNPFEQGENSASRRYQGTGLGLSLTKKIVELHGGKIWAESDGEGKGSTFHFVIPISLCPSKTEQIENDRIKN